MDITRSTFHNSPREHTPEKIITTYDHQNIYKNQNGIYVNNAEGGPWRCVLAGMSDTTHSSLLGNGANIEKSFASNKEFEFSFLLAEKNQKELESCVQELIRLGKHQLYVFYKDLEDVRLTLDTLFYVYQKYPDFRFLFSYDHGVLLGVVYGQPVTPPKRAVIELHDDCNLKCDFCWTHSPLMKKGFFTKPKKVLDLKMFYQYVDELAAASVELVELCAVGDPLYHPHVWEMIHYIKQKGLLLRISTNGTLISKKNAEDMIKWGVDELSMNISGGEPDSYAAIHNVSARLFHHLKKTLSYMAALRNAVANSPLQMKHIHVLTEKNARTLDAMIYFAHETGANALSFRTVWPHRAFLQKLDLSNDTLLFLLERIDHYQEMANGFDIEHNLPFLKRELTTLSQQRNLQTTKNVLPLESSATDIISMNTKISSVHPLPQISVLKYIRDPKNLNTNWVQKKLANEKVQKIYNATFLGFSARNAIRRDIQPACVVSYHFSLLGADNNLRFCCRGDKNAEKYKNLKEQWSNMRYQSFRSSWKAAYGQKKSLCAGCPHVEENHYYSELLKKHRLDDLV
jgi:uncharacterized Fe-S cluster-containing radical SAM superfamily protein